MFDSYREHHQLTRRQSDILDRGERMLTPDVLAVGLSGAALQEVQAIAADVRSEIGANAAAELFESAGPITSARSALPFAERLAYSWRTSSVRVAIARATPFVEADIVCNCAVGGPDDGSNCGNEMHCFFDDNTCPQSAWTTSGCGPWWESPCDGTCSFHQVGG